MAKRGTTDDHLALLRNLRTQEKSERAIAELTGLLDSSRLHGMVLKGAAELAEKWDARALAPAICGAAKSVAGVDGAKRDPGCEGKQAALEVLIAWESDVPSCFLEAATWKQRETRWSNDPKKPSVFDSAAECRGLAAIGVAQTRAGGAEALTLLIDLLADGESATRLRAAQALAIWRGAETLPLLRLKAHCGDESADVLGEVLVALLRHDPRGQISFVSRFLDGEEPQVAEAAALALGESRQAAALSPLVAAWERYAREPIGSSLLMAIALLRQEESLEWLLEKLAGARLGAAKDLLHAMRIYRGDERVVPRIEAVARKRGREFVEALGEVFE